MSGLSVSKGLGLVMALTVALAGEAKAASELHDAMEGLNKAYKKLKVQIADAGKNAASLELVDQMQKHVVTAKAQVPPQVAKAAEAERAKLLVTYRTAMMGLMSSLIELEKALVEGKNDVAAELLKKVNDIKGKGHEQFQVQD